MVYVVGLVIPINFKRPALTNIVTTLVQTYIAGKCLELGITRIPELQSASPETPHTSHQYVESLRHRTGSVLSTEEAIG